MTDGMASRLAVALDAAMYRRTMTPQMLADELGLNVVTVRRWLRGDHVMGLAEAQAAARVLRAPGDLFVYPPATREEALDMLARHDAGRPPEVSESPPAAGPGDVELGRQFARDAAARAPRPAARPRRSRPGPR